MRERALLWRDGTALGAVCGAAVYAVLLVIDRAQAGTFSVPEYQLLGLGVAGVYGALVGFAAIVVAGAFASAFSGRIGRLASPLVGGCVVAVMLIPLDRSWGLPALFTVGAALVGAVLTAWLLARSRSRSTAADEASSGRVRAEASHG